MTIKHGRIFKNQVSFSLFRCSGMNLSHLKTWSRDLLELLFLQRVCCAFVHSKAWLKWHWLESDRDGKVLDFNSLFTMLGWSEAITPCYCSMLQKRILNLWINTASEASDSEKASVNCVRSKHLSVLTQTLIHLWLNAGVTDMNILLSTQEHKQAHTQLEFTDNTFPPMRCKSSAPVRTDPRFH